MTGDEDEGLPEIDVVTVTWDRGSGKAVCDVGRVGVPLAILLLSRAQESLEALVPGVDVRVDGELVVEDLGHGWTGEGWER
jgi:hypothetical protein